MHHQPSPPSRPAPAPVIILLAAGAGTRFGGIKQLAVVGGEPMVRRCARIALAPGVPVVVVTGAHAQAVEAALQGLALQIVHNAAWHEGMGGSIAVAIRLVTSRFPDADGALICLADQPLLTDALLAAMLERHAHRAGRILACDNAGHAGPPVLFPRDLFDQLQQMRGEPGARELLQRERARLDRLPLSAGADVDTLAALEQVRSHLRF